jgi:hypothetical protein
MNFNFEDFGIVGVPGYGYSNKKKQSKKGIPEKKSSNVSSTYVYKPKPSRPLNKTNTKDTKILNYEDFGIVGVPGY